LYWKRKKNQIVRASNKKTSWADCGGELRNPSTCSCLQFVLIPVGCHNKISIFEWNPEDTTNVTNTVFWVASDLVAVMARHQGSRLWNILLNITSLNILGSAPKKLKGGETDAWGCRTNIDTHGKHDKHR
jgi:hypothetical protein